MNFQDFNERLTHNNYSKISITKTETGYITQEDFDMLITNDTFSSKHIVRNDMLVKLTDYEVDLLLDSYGLQKALDLATNEYGNWIVSCRGWNNRLRDREPIHLSFNKILLDIVLDYESDITYEGFLSVHPESKPKEAKDEEDPEEEADPEDDWHVVYQEEVERIDGINTTTYHTYGGGAAGGIFVKGNKVYSWNQEWFQKRIYTLLPITAKHVQLKWVIHDKHNKTKHIKYVK